MELCTKELVMSDIVKEHHGNRFRRSNHSMVSLALLNETLFDPNTDAAARQHEVSLRPSRRRHQAL